MRVEDYARLLDALAEGVYGLDREARVTFVNAAAERLTGWPRAEQIGQRQHELIHHSYRDGTPYPASECPICATLRNGVIQRGEEYFWNREGSCFLVSFTSAPVHDTTGELSGAVVSFSDRSIERRYYALVKATSNYVWLCDATGALQEVDPEWLELTGLSRERVLSEGFRAALHPDEHAGYMERRADAIARRQAFEEEVRLRCADGSLRWFHHRLIPVRDHHSRVIEWVGTGEEITGRKRHEASLELRAARDELTGLLNRRGLNELMDGEMNKALTLEEPLSLVLLDVDHFKNINDSYGHAGGDAVLAGLAGVIAEATRGSDILARWGGEEFAVLLPGADLSAAALIAEKIRRRVGATALLQGRSVSISLGVTQYSPRDTNDALFRRADEALYKSKHGGRNRVTTLPE